MNETKLKKKILIKRLCDISNYGEYIPLPFDYFLEKYKNEPISYIEKILKMRREEKIDHLVSLIQSNKITHYRAYCKKFKIKGYSVINFEQLKKALTNEINQQISFINKIYNN